MPTGFETTLVKTVSRVAGQLLSSVQSERRVRRVRDTARPIIAQETAAGLLDELSPAEAASLANYLVSPDFEQVALQTVIASMHGNAAANEEHLSAVREQVRHALRLRVGLPAERLLGLTDVVLDATRAATTPSAMLPTGVPETLILQGHLTGAGARNGALLGRLADLREMHTDLTRLRAQVAHLHADLRMPHAGIARSVPWNQLYVTPRLHREHDENVTVGPDELIEAGARHVILGDPGAGKSTLAEKVAHDLAADSDGTVVPLLVVLRRFSAALEAGERTLVEHLVAVCKDPYNVSLTSETVDYLLLNGHALIILDGFDELTDVALRRRVADLVKGFVLMYPLVPLLVTSRRVGYHEAALDSDLFMPCALARFDPNRVEAYVRHWFALDDGSAPAGRDRLAGAFLRESASIEDLRSSPLLLSVLCAMYAADHFIPENRGQVYERCALMVFDRWDRMRGVARTLGFEGRVRSAVQYLAWTLFTTSASPEQPRSRILRILERHLTGKGFDEDEAAVVAAEFLDHCAGRAWILTEVGTAATEPIYGFAHRTFLEYFTAEHLVRAAKTPEAVWAELSPHVRNGSWEVVAQLALQLIDRNVDDGGDAVLRLALDETPDLTAFCARSLGDVCVLPTTVTRIVAGAVDRACALGISARLFIAPSDEDFETVRAADEPMHQAMYRALPGNLPFVRRALADAIADRVDADDDVALFLGARLDWAGLGPDDERQEVWRALSKEYRERFPAAWQRWESTWPAIIVDRDTTPADAIVSRQGPLPFYMSDLAFTTASYPSVLELLIEGSGQGPAPREPVPPLAFDLMRLLLRSPTPWLPPLERPSQAAMSSFVVTRLLTAPLPASGDGLATRIVLCLPYMEYGFLDLDSDSIVSELLRARRAGRVPAVLRNSLSQRGLPAHVRDFVFRWVRGQVHTVGEKVRLP